MTQHTPGPEYETTNGAIRLMFDLAGDTIAITRKRVDDVTVTLFTVTPKQAYELMDGLADAAERVVDHRERIK